MKKIIHPIIIALCFLSLLSCNAQTKTNLSADEFDAGISKDAIQILDVRTPAEYAKGHIKNTLLANWNDKKEFERRVAFIDKNKPVYVYCLSGGRSASAAEKLRAEGFIKVYELNGGINAWKAANKSIEGATTTNQMSMEEFNAAIISSKTVLVEFGATWCPPCKQMEPIIQKLQKENSDKFLLVKVDGGNDETVMQAYKVTALPVFIIFKDGKEVWRKDGIVSEEEFKKVL